MLVEVLTAKDIINNKCITNKKKCKHLHILRAYSPDIKKDIHIFVCSSKDDTGTHCWHDYEPSAWTIDDIVNPKKILVKIPLSDDNLIQLKKRKNILIECLNLYDLLIYYEQKKERGKK